MKTIAYGELWYSSRIDSEGICSAVKWTFIIKGLDTTNRSVSLPAGWKDTMYKSAQDLFLSALKMPIHVYTTCMRSRIVQAKSSPCRKKKSCGNLEIFG